MGSAFHAMAANQPDSETLLNRLTPEERAEIATWKRPELAKPLDGIELEYAHAHIEHTVAIRHDGAGTQDNDDPEILSLGHVDMYWLAQDAQGRPLIVVGDIKRSRWTTSGPDSLQLLAYGYALSQIHNTTGFVPGIWDATNGGWFWGRFFDMDQEGGPLFARIMDAATHTADRPTVGSYCAECYGVQHCKAFVLHAAAAETVLAPMAEGAELTPNNVLSVLLAYEAAKKLYEGPVKEALKLFAERHGGITDPSTGRTWRPVQTGGRESVSVKRVREVFGADADKVVAQGAPVQQYRWVKS